MPRRGRSASPPPVRSVPMRAAPAAHPPMRTAPAAHPPAAPAQPAVVHEQPSMFKQMAATAGGVAVGSAVGHAVGHGLTSMFSGGGGSGEVAAQPAGAAPAAQHYAPQGAQEPTGPCAFEIKQFLKCAADQDDLTLCSGFNEAIRLCKENNRLA